MSDEVRLVLPDGARLCFPTAAAEPSGVSYVRVVTPEGVEEAYWDSDEWGEEPQAVMGALLGALCGHCRTEAGS